MVRFGGREWLVDPGRGGERGRSWCSSDEAFRGALVGGVEDALAACRERRGVAVMDARRGHQRDPGVVVVVVVPGEECAAEDAGVVERCEARRERRAVLQGLEVRFRERVVGRGVGSAVGLLDAEVGEQERNWF